MTTSSNEAINASVTLGASETFMDGDLTVRGKARYLMEQQDYESNGVFGSQFSVQDVPNFAAIAGETSANNSIRTIKAEGLFAIASADYQGKYIVDGLVRRDGSSLFGPEERWQTYYRGSAAWRLSQEDWWGSTGSTSSSSGSHSEPRADVRTSSLSTKPLASRLARSSRSTWGNAALKPEYTVEQEAGINMVIADKFGIDLTYAWQTTDDQLLQVPQPAFVGFSSQWQNAGEIEAETYEVSLRYSAIDTRDTGLQFRFLWDRTKQMITRLDVPDFTQGGNFFVSEGAPLGELWGEKWATSCADLGPIGISSADCAENFQVNDDGVLVATGGADYKDGFVSSLWGTQVTVATADGSNNYAWGNPIKTSDYSPACVRKHPNSFQNDCTLTQFLPFGNTTPDFNASFATNFRYKGLSVNSLLETSIGHSIYNGTAQWALRELRGEDVDQRGKESGHQKPVGYASASSIQ